MSLRFALGQRIAGARHILSFSLTVVAFLPASLGQAFLNRRVHEREAVVLYFVAMALTLIAFRHSSERRTPREKLRPSRWSLGGTIELLIASLPAWIASGLLVWRWQNLAGAFPLYLLSLAAVGYVCYRHERWKLARPGVLKEHWAELVLLALVLGCGLFLRFHRLEYYPPPETICWNDEAQVGKDAYGVIHHGYHPWQLPVSIYATVLSFRVLGPTVFALRLPFVVLGFLTLIAFYLLARELFSFPIALAATMLFSVSRWHIAFTRLVLPSTPAMLLEVTTFYLLLRGRRTAGMFSYVVAGLTMSLGLYSHASYRIVPLLVLLLFIDQAWSSWLSGGRMWRQRLKDLGQDCRGWLAFSVSAILFLAPFAAIVLREPQRAFGERFTAVTPVLFAPHNAEHVDTVLQQARQVLGFFNYRGEPWGAVNLPDLPMLDPWTAVLFVLGLGYCLFYFRRDRHLFYLAWFFITLVGGGVLTVDLRSHRFAGVMPVLYLFAASFIDQAWASFRRVVGLSRQVYFSFVVLPVVVLAGYSNYHIFFYRQIDDASVRVEFTREVTAIANYIASLGEGHYFYVFANHPYYEPGMDFAWMAGEPPGERGLDILDAIPSHREVENEVLVYVFSTPYDVQALSDATRYFYPQALIEPHEGEYDRYTFVTARVKPEDARGVQGLTGRYYSGHRHPGEPDLMRQDEQVSFDWRLQEPPLPFPFSVEWEGTVYAPEDGKYAFEIEATGKAQLYLDERALGYGDELRLVKGWHTLRVLYESDEHRGSVQLLWTAPQRDREVVPAGFLSPRAEVNGVLVSYFEGPDWMGDPVQQRIEPTLSLLGVPTAWQSAPLPELSGKLYSLDGQGELRVEEPGSYHFNVVPRNGFATLLVDGEEMITVDSMSVVSYKGEIHLSRGWHDLHLRYSYRGGEFSGVQVLWTAPGEKTQSIPPEALRPPP